MSSSERSGCPVSDSHEYRAPQAGDSRSVCPGLNTMANHGYIPRDGKNMGIWTLIRGLKECFNLSFPLSFLLSFGVFVLIRRFPKVDLTAFDKHGGLEHDASLVHLDCPVGQQYPPIEVQKDLVQELLKDAQTKDGEAILDEEAGARARIRREKQSPPLSSFPASIAKQEIALILGVFGKGSEAKEGVPLSLVMPWLEEERLPAGWKPDHKQTLRDVLRRSKIIGKAMERIQAEEQKS
ncbi:Chloroperoxidase [Mycena floridula]|nr:Chloroperoxidase [Mycena floridula]